MPYQVTLSCKHPDLQKDITLTTTDEEYNQIAYLAEQKCLPDLGEACDDDSLQTMRVKLTKAIKIDKVKSENSNYKKEYLETLMNFPYNTPDLIHGGCHFKADNGKEVVVLGSKISEDSHKALKDLKLTKASYKKFSEQIEHYSAWKMMDFLEKADFYWENPNGEFELYSPELPFVKKHFVNGGLRLNDKRVILLSSTEQMTNLLSKLENFEPERISRKDAIEEFKLCSKNRNYTKLLIYLEQETNFRIMPYSKVCPLGSEE